MQYLYVQGVKYVCFEVCIVIFNSVVNTVFNFYSGHTFAAGLKTLK